ncbi:MAG: hypothetical protein ACRDGD_12700 [Candidatus Limnocylindria bacterium]
MRDLGGRLFIGLAAVAAGVMALGYAFIFSGIAAPSDSFGTVEVPAAGQVVAARLADGRPVFVGAGGGAAWVLDAREPRESGELDVLLGWCPTDQAFVGTRPTSIFAADGSVLRRDGTGMTAYATTPAGGDTSRLRVEAQTSVRPVAAEERMLQYTCDPGDWIAHRAQPDEVFDPSVAVDQEPPGWIWLSGTLVAAGDEIALCDGASSACERSAPVRGIDPAKVTATHGGRVAGTFIGRVRDGALEGLILVPDLGGSS